MRTTITIDDDVAVLLDGLRRERGGTFRQVVNDALRAGLVHLTGPGPRAPVQPTRTVSLGPLLLPSLDDVSEALAQVEGDAYR